MKKLKMVIYGILLFVLGAGLAAHVTVKRFRRDIVSLGDTITYNQSVHSAASYAQLLLSAREGNSTSLVQRLEALTDGALWLALTSTNATFCVRQDFPWATLKADRDAYPRQSMPKCQMQIEAFLDKLTKEQPQHHPAPYPEPPTVQER